MINLKQDRNGVRTATDVERRHKLGLIKKTAEEVEEIKEIDANFSSTSTRAVQNKVITTAINRLFNEKVDKVSGMTLSHNDYTDTDKNKVNNLDGHVHNNIEILNSITSQDITNWNATSFVTYSGNEQVIGTYFDKPLYAKTIYISSFPNATVQNYATGISNLKFASHVYGYAATEDGSNLIVNAPRPDFAQNEIGAWVLNGQLRISTGVDRSSHSGHITIEYTKTTD